MTETQTKLPPHDQQNMMTLHMPHTRADPELLEKLLAAYERNKTK